MKTKQNSSVAQVDLNADLAEGCPNDLALLEIVTSANICSGLHAGNAQIMATTIQQAKQHQVRLGAHPSYPDRQNFGRQVLPFTSTFTPEDLAAYLYYQLGATQAVCHSLDTELSYVKPHGALYNQANKDPQLATLIVETVKRFDPNLSLMSLAGGLLLKTAEQAGLATIAEVFADRRYLADGSLVPRSHPQALIHRDDEAIQQVLQMVTEGKVTTLDGSEIAITAESICLHGDGEHALIFAQKIKQQLLQQGIHVIAKF